jgi:NDP-sugar pyrophosphorylase family protein
MEITCAAILSAGEGTRLRDAGWTVPKPMLPVGGMPLLHRLLRLLDTCGIETVHCILRSDSAEAARSVANLGLRRRPHFVIHDTPSSLHSFFALSEFLHDQPGFLLTTVDSIVPADQFQVYVQACRADTVSTGVLACTSFVEDERPLWARVEAGNRIVNLGPTQQGAAWVTGGFYALRADALESLEEARRRGLSRLRNYLSLLLEQNKVLTAYHFPKIVDVDDAADVAEAEKLLFDTARQHEPWRPRP